MVPLAKWMDEYWLHLYSGVRSVFDCMALPFASLQLYTWNDIRQCNCKNQLHRLFSRPEASFEFNLLAEVRLSSHSDMLGPMLWPSSPSVKPQLSDWWQLSMKSVHVCNPAKPMRSSENTKCPRAPWTDGTSFRPAGAVLRSVRPR